MRFDKVRADRLTAVVLFVLGTAMLYGGYVMDRLEIRRIHPSSIPGLVPMLLGGALAVCAVLLISSSGRGASDDAEDAPLSWQSIGLTLLICLLYALGLVGTVPFFWATAAFITVFAALFGLRDGDGTRSTARTLVFSLLFGLIVAGGISLLFRYGFLVRLP